MNDEPYWSILGIKPQTQFKYYFEEFWHSSAPACLFSFSETHVVGTLNLYLRQCRASFLAAKQALHIEISLTHSVTHRPLAYSESSRNTEASRGIQ
jgi:hypothetical protein